MMGYFSRACMAAAMVVVMGQPSTSPAQQRSPSESVQPDLQSLRPPAGQVLNAEDMFEILDLDGDGQVDRAEWRNRKMLVYYVADKNRDNVLDRDEIPALSEEVFMAADDNGDGQLSGYEFNQADFTQFEAIDSSGDGVITLDEFTEYMSTVRSE